MPRTRAPKVITVDFETEAIAQRPRYPPKPVSVGIKWPDEREHRLLAWGHGGGGNNCTEKQARGELKRAYDSQYPLLFQNSSFDLDVAEVHWQLPLLDWRRVHDSMYLIFLFDPHSPSLGLKQSAERMLGIPPEEQDRVKEWVLANVPEAARKPSTAGAYICRCPFKIVAPYLKGDLTRTLKLFNYLWPQITDSGMGEAYDRERRLMPVLLRNSRRGIRVDIAALERDLPLMQGGVKKVDDWLRKRLGDINLDSDRQLGEALYSKGIVTDFHRTAKGQLSVSKLHLTIDKFADKKVYQALTYRGQMSTSVNMFMMPWAELASSTVEKVLHPNWIQVRASHGARDASGGARSGRIICTRPNILNVPKRWVRSVSAGYVHPKFVGDIPELPFMRNYVIPRKGKQWAKFDYSQQEIRLFAHFVEGTVMEGFLQNRDYDIHELVRAEAEQALIAAGLRTSFDRDSAKGVTFGKLYGLGLIGLMANLKLREEDRPVAQIIQKAFDKAVPSVRELSTQLKALANDKSPEYPNGRPIRTIGGRLYFCEPPSYSERFGRDMTWEFKQLSYLCQGSGADVTKEALCRYEEHPKRTGEFNVTLYDELDADIPLSAKGAKHEMGVIKECMESIECDVPLLTDGSVGPSWGTLTKWKG